jgi:outer membrane protein TolC
MLPIVKKLLLLIFLCSSMWADPVGLADLIDLALKNNPETTKSWAGVKKAQAQMGAAKSDYYPAVGIQGKLVQGRDVKFVNGPEVVYTNYGADLILSYVLFDFGVRRAGVQATREALKASNWSVDFAIQQVICNVATSYYQYLNAENLLMTKKSTLEDAGQMRDIAEDLFKSGLKAEGDQGVSRGAVAQQQIELAKARAMVAIAYGKLLMSLGLLPETKLEIRAVDEQAYPGITAGTENLIALAQEKRTDILAKKAQLAALHETVKKSRRTPRPKLKFLGQGGWIEYAKHKDRGYNYSAGLMLDIPLFKGFENSYQTRMALADEEMTAAELKILQEEVALEVLTYTESVKAAEAALKWSDLYLEEATKSYGASMENYKAGLQNIFDVLQMQRSLADARMKKTEARTEWLVSLAQLAFTTGSLNP